MKPFSLLMRIRYIPYKLELEQAYLDEIKSDIPNIEEIKNASSYAAAGINGSSGAAGSAGTVTKTQVSSNSFFIVGCLV